MKEACLWCKHWRSEYRPHPYMDYKTRTWYIGVSLFLGCTKGPVDDPNKNHNDWCDSFVWNFEKDKDV